MIIAGLSTMALGGAVASPDLLVGLILLLLAPLIVSFCGALVVVIGLVRRPDDGSRPLQTRRIIAVGGLAGLSYAFGFLALSILSQLPDYAAGLNGSYLPAPIQPVFVIATIGLLAGLGLGILVALTWRTIRRRQVPQEASSSR